MGYVLPRAVIVLIAWGATCVVMHACTTVDPLLFYIAGGVWALAGLVCFGYLHKLRQDTPPRPSALTVQRRSAV
jgi:hypothetical protein